MNMTVVIISKRSVEMQLLVVWALVAILAWAGEFGAAAPTDEGLPESTKLIVDESQPMDDDLLDSIVKEYGENVKQTMDSEIGRLIADLEQSDTPKRASTPSRAKVNEADLVRLRRANEQASAEIKTRIELAADKSGALPQWSPGQAAAGLLSAASTRLQAAGSFTGDRLRSLAQYAADKAPARLRRFFRWPSFASFKAKFNKNYSMREELYRQMVYLRNQVLVGVQWVRYLFRRDKYLTGATQFSDWTEEEYQKTFRNEAESEAGADDGLGSLSDAAKLKLLQLAQSGKNAFGQQVVSSSRRRKRQVGEGDESGDESEYDELNDTEDDGLDLALEDEDDDNDGANNDSKMTPEEEFRLLEEFSNANLEGDSSDLEDVSDLADEALALNSDFKQIDLRDTRCIIGSEDQHTCGNCYAQVITAAATYYNCMASQDKRHVRFHSRFLSDCGGYMKLDDDKPARINGCAGGLMSHTYKFAQRVGLQLFGEYQCARVGYKFANDTCVYPEPGNLDESGWNVVPIEQYKRSRLIRLRLSEVDLHLRTIGPVYANIRPWANFKQFSKGIYNEFEDDPTSGVHSVLIVGHDIDTKGEHYYVLRNTHGTSWGENGFFRIYNKSLDYFGSSYSGLAPMELDD